MGVTALLSADAINRPALYYPYIHIRSERWLKATLLCVPAVKRIVPETYSPEDLPSIIKFTEISGPNGLLLQGVPTFSPAADDAQQRLLDKLRQHIDEILARYERRHAPPVDEYWIHDAKFHSELLHYLVDHDLAWRSHDPGAYGRRTWYALHPVLGSAMMTTLGLSIAREQRYDIVTPSLRFHETLLTAHEEAIFDTLLIDEQQPAVPSMSQVRNDLGQLVVSLTGVNLRALQPEDIPELQASKRFAMFQRLIRNYAEGINPSENAEVYEAQLKRGAQEIIEAWHNVNIELGRAIKDALFETGLTLTGEALKSLLTGASTTELAVAGGVAVGLLAQKGRRIIQNRAQAGPYQFLTEVARAERESLRLTFPLGLEP